MSRLWECGDEKRGGFAIRDETRDKRRWKEPIKGNDKWDARAQERERERERERVVGISLPVFPDRNKPSLENTRARETASRK